MNARWCNERQSLTGIIAEVCANAFIGILLGNMEEFIPCCFGFDFLQFFESVTLYKYRESIGFLVITPDMGDIVDLEQCEVAGRC